MEISKLTTGNLNARLWTQHDKISSAAICGMIQLYAGLDVYQVTRRRPLAIPNHAQLERATMLYNQHPLSPHITLELLLTGDDCLTEDPETFVLMWQRSMSPAPGSMLLSVLCSMVQVGYFTSSVVYAFEDLHRKYISESAQDHSQPKSIQAICPQVALNEAASFLRKEFTTCKKIEHCGIECLELSVDNNVAGHLIPAGFTGEPCLKLVHPLLPSSPYALPSLKFSTLQLRSGEWWHQMVVWGRSLRTSDFPRNVIRMSMGTITLSFAPDANYARMRAFFGSSHQIDQTAAGYYTIVLASTELQELLVRHCSSVMVENLLAEQTIHAAVSAYAYVSESTINFLADSIVADTGLPREFVLAHIKRLHENTVN